MKIFKSFPFWIIVALILLVGIIESAYYFTSPDYKEGKYVMTYRVYYPNNPRDYVIENNLPIFIDSYRGTNIVYKIKSDNTIFNKIYHNISVFRTSAPIEVVSYSNKEK